MISFPRLATSLLAGAALSVLAACGPGAPPPAAPAPVETGDTLATEGVADEVYQTAGEEAGQGEAHTHETSDDDEHDHDHDHDHEADHAGGTAHVHGVADLAFAIEGGKLTAELMSPLANFGLSEADGVITDDVKAALPGLITLTGGNCTGDAPVAKVDTSSGHTDGHVNFSWTCANLVDVSAARFAGFAAFPGFETINAVFLGDTVQKAAELTPSSPELSLK
ncbi:MAG: DUF2796 domain-containing protein [Hyphomonas sp.]